MGTCVGPMSVDTVADDRNALPLVLVIFLAGKGHDPAWQTPCSERLD